MVPFYGRGSTASRLEPLRGGSLLFTTKFPEISGTHFTVLGRMKGWVDLGATQWFWARDPRIGNPAPWPLGHCSIIMHALRMIGWWKDWSRYLMEPWGEEFIPEITFSKYCSFNFPDDVINSKLGQKGLKPVISCTNGDRQMKFNSKEKTEMKHSSLKPVFQNFGNFDFPSWRHQSRSGSKSSK